MHWVPHPFRVICGMGGKPITLLKGQIYKENANGVPRKGNSGDCDGNFPLLQNLDLRGRPKGRQLPFPQQPETCARFPAQSPNVNPPKARRETLQAQQRFAHQRDRALPIPALPVMASRAHLNQRLQKALLRFVRT